MLNSVFNSVRGVFAWVFLQYVYIFLIFKAISNGSASPPNLVGMQTYSP